MRLLKLSWLFSFSFEFQLFRMILRGLTTNNHNKEINSSLKIFLHDTAALKMFTKIFIYLRISIHIHVYIHLISYRHNICHITQWGYRELLLQRAYVII